MDEDVKKKLTQVEELLSEIRANTAPAWWRSILNGILTGAGWVAGTVLAIFLLGWILSIFGVIPGFDQMATQLKTILNTKL